MACCAAGTVIDEGGHVMPQVVKDFAAALERVQAAQRPGVEADACLAHFTRLRASNGKGLQVTASPPACVHP